MEVAIVIGMMRSGEISEEAVVEEIDGIDSKVINELLDNAEMWICPKCQELNYVSISECWKFQTGNPDFDESISELNDLE